MIHFLYRLGVAASILAYYDMHVSLVLEEIDGSIALQCLIKSLAQNSNDGQVSQILNHYTLISGKFEISQQSKSRCDRLMGLQLLERGCYEEFGQWMGDEDDKVECALEAAKNYLMSGQISQAQKSLETVSQQSDTASCAYSLVDSLKTVPLMWDQVTESLFVAIRGINLFISSYYYSLGGK